MEIRVLNYFLAVAREKNISRAAKSLHLSQPTLSKQLKDLEEELGVVLFERGNREIRLTEAGLFLYSKGNEIISLINKTTSNLREKEVVSGGVYIGGGETQAMSLIARVMKELMLDYPDIKISLYSGNADDVMQKLDNGLLDFGLVIDPTNKQKYEYVRLPLMDTWGILVRRDNPLAAKASVQATDLAEVPLLVSQQSLVRNQIAEWLGNNLAHFNIVGNYNLLYNASLMVEQGVGLAVCIDGIVNTEKKNIVFVPFEPELKASLNIIWKKNQPLSNAAVKFLERLRMRI